MMGMFWASCQNHGSAPVDNSYQGAVISLNPTAYWKLDETAGTVATDSVGTNSGTYTDGYTLDQPPAIAVGRSVLFDGTSGFVNTPNKTSGGDYSVIAFVNRSGSDVGNSSIYGETVSTATDYGCLFYFTSSGTLRFGQFKGVSGQWDFAEVPAVDVPTGQWLQVVGVRVASGTHKIYVNAVEKASVPASPPTPQATYGGQIGVDPYRSAPRWFDGFIDEVAVYDGKALTPAEISLLYSKINDT